MRVDLVDPVPATLICHPEDILAQRQESSRESPENKFLKTNNHGPPLQACQAREAPRAARAAPVGRQRPRTGDLHRDQHRGQEERLPGEETLGRLKMR